MTNQIVESGVFSTRQLLENKLHLNSLQAIHLLKLFKGRYNLLCSFIEGSVLGSYTYILTDKEKDDIFIEVRNNYVKKLKSLNTRSNELHSLLLQIENEKKEIYSKIGKYHEY